MHALQSYQALVGLGFPDPLRFIWATLGGLTAHGTADRSPG